MGVSMSVALGFSWLSGEVARLTSKTPILILYSPMDGWFVFFLLVVAHLKYLDIDMQYVN